MNKTDILENLFVFTDNRNPKKLPMAFWKMWGEISAKKVAFTEKKKKKKVVTFIIQQFHQSALCW